jgi:hypothetical protein
MPRHLGSCEFLQCSIDSQAVVTAVRYCSYLCHDCCVSAVSVTLNRVPGANVKAYYEFCSGALNVASNRVSDTKIMPCYKFCVSAVSVTLNRVPGANVKAYYEFCTGALNVASNRVSDTKIMPCYKFCVSAVSVAVSHLASTAKSSRLDD